MDGVGVCIAAGLWGDWIAPVALLVFGFGFVVFFHELGHFLACKAVGIKVEQFALGFGPRLVGIKRGGTDYCLNLLPLGGYVKPLGQEDFKPMDPDNPDAGDPGAFDNRPIWARLVMVSAGVVMNVILAAILFVVICLVGIKFPAPLVGGVVKGFPADQARITWDDPAIERPAGAAIGLKTGDRILAIGDEEVTRFDNLSIKAILAGRDDRFDMRIEREVDGQTWIGTADIGVKEDKAQGRLVFGIAPPTDTEFADLEDNTSHSPFGDGDRLLAIDGKDIRHHWDIEPIEKALDGSDVIVTIDRKDKRVDVTVRPVPYVGGGALLLKDGTFVRGEIDYDASDDEHIVMILEDGSKRTIPIDSIAGELLDVLGLIPRLTVAMVVNGSPADKAGLVPADIIVRYGDHPAPTLSKLHELNDRVVETGAEIVVLRDGKEMPAVRITPKRRGEKVLIGINPGIDVDHTIVAGVRAGSLAEGAGLRGGDVIQRINGREMKTWNDIVAARVAAGDGEVTIEYHRGVHPLQATIASAAGAPIRPEDYRFKLFSTSGFKMLRGPEVKITNPLAAVAWGASEALDWTIWTYATLRSLAMRTVSPSTLRGPVGIMAIGVKVARKDFVDMLRLLAIISVSLAVFNFLPLPIVDGGHVVLLAIEKVRGKPLSIKAMNVITIVGVSLFVCLFVAITWSDIARIIRNMW